MRQLAVLAMVTGLVSLVSFAKADQGGEVKCKAEGLHLCCATCDNTVKAILGKMDGVSNVKVDRKAADQVTFTAKTEKEANAALDALVKGGFCCSVTAGSKTMTPTFAKLDLKADTVTFNDVHICCGACTTAVKGLFTDAKVTVAGKGAQKSVTIAGKNLDAQVVADKMRKAGFTGNLEVKK